MRTIPKAGIVAVAMILAGAFIAYAHGSQESTSSASAGSAAPAPVHLYGYLLGSPPAGFDAVMAALNKKLKADMNTTATIGYIGWSDVNSKYPLLLASGENLDWIFTANWVQFNAQAARGAFLALTPKMLQTDMPLLWPKVPKVGWQQASIGGTIYMIPTPSPDRKVGVALIRGDLRTKYGIPPVKNIVDLGPYLAAVKKNDPDMIPMDLGNGYDVTVIYSDVMNQFSPPMGGPLATYTPLVYNYTEKNPKIVSMLAPPYADAFRQTVTLLKSWHDLGYIDNNPFGNSVRSRESFLQGKSAVALGNSQDVQGTLSQAQKNGWQVDIIPIINRQSNTALADPYINNGVAIGAQSKHPNRALQFLDRIIEDPAYDYLVYFGIEGKNYVMADNGTKIQTLPGDNYPVDAAGFWFTDKNLFKPLTSWSPAYLNLRSEVSKWLVDAPYSAFAFTPQNVQTQYANLTAAYQQYALPLFVGLEPNVDQGIKSLQSQLDTAGLSTVIAEANKQFTAFGNEFSK
ncbi:MAG TPA: DUF3502 domain-containing protein [Spirochaetia bacterium]|nr:DUF3502 domain-containing protein [Spirochaetia bacterium]